MIQLLRNMRQNLLLENKIAKYLKYALGEIILVVIGILIALKINNLNQNYNDKAKEKQYLLNIREELITDSLFYESYIKNSYDFKVKNLNLAISYHKGISTIVDTLSFIKNIARGGSFDQVIWSKNSITYTDLINSGNLNIIRDANIKKQIMAYYSRLKMMDDQANEHRSEYRNYIRSFITWNWWDENASNDPYGIIILLNHLKSEQFFQKCNLEMTNAQYTLDRAKGTTKSSNALVIQIDNYLHKKS